MQVMVSCRTFQSHSRTLSKSEVGKWPPPSGCSRPERSKSRRAGLTEERSLLGQKPRVTITSAGVRNSLGRCYWRIYISDKAYRFNCRGAAKMFLGSEHHSQFEKKWRPLPLPSWLPEHVDRTSERSPKDTQNAYWRTHLKDGYGCIAEWGGSQENLSGSEDSRAGVVPNNQKYT